MTWYDSYEIVKEAVNKGVKVFTSAWLAQQQGIKKTVAVKNLNKIAKAGYLIVSYDGLTTVFKVNPNKPMD